MSFSATRASSAPNAWSASAEALTLPPWQPQVSPSDSDASYGGQQGEGWSSDAPDEANGTSESQSAEDANYAN